ncbi:MAG: hypothetical protein R6U38_13555 [Desulfatiglandaceae bacterium]
MRQKGMVLDKRVGAVTEAAARVLLKHATNLPSDQLRQLTSKEERYYAAVAGVITPFLGRAPDRGVLTAVTFSLLGMCNWIYSWYDPTGPIGPERLSEIIIAIFTGGVRSVGQYPNSPG